MNARAKQLTEIGLTVFRDADARPGVSQAHCLIEAFAAMLAAPAAKKQSKDPDAPKLPFAPQVLFEAVRQRVPNVVACDAVESSIFGRLGKALKGIPGLVVEDVDRLVSWIEAGGMAGWPVQPTFQMVVANIGKYLSWARAWDARGRQPISRGSWAQADMSQPSDVGSMFK